MGKNNNKDTISIFLVKGWESKDLFWEKFDIFFKIKGEYDSIEEAPVSFQEFWMKVIELRSRSGRKIYFMFEIKN